MLNKHCNYALAAAGAFSMMLFTGCIDESYDLRDIDTTMQFEVDNLTLPLNLAPIQFDDMVDLSDEECIEIIDGEYVLVKNGDFNSEEIHIRDIKSSAVKGEQPSSQHMATVVSGVDIPLATAKFPFSYTYNNVDKYIKKIVSGKVDLTLTVVLSTKYDDGKAIECDLKNLVFELPAGFYGTTGNGDVIDADSGNEVSVASARTDANGEYKFNFHVTSFGFEATGAELDGQSFHLATDMTLKSGTLTSLNGNGNPGSISLDFNISDLEVSTFTGRVYYAVENLDPEDVELNDLPDVLRDKETKIRLKNPQLFVKLQNPLDNYGITASTGVIITQIRPADEEIERASLLRRLQVAPIAGFQNFCLSPINDVANIEGFENAQWNEMQNLGSIVYGNGLPEGLHIEFDSPMMDEADVVDFELGQDLGAIHGDYKFFAPLDLDNGSFIYYTDEATGWGLSSDSDELEIRHLSIEADAVSNLPVAMTLTATPIDVDGNLITDVKVTKVDIPAFGKERIEIKMEGTIRNLDGMRYVLTVKAGQDTEALKPTQSLTLNNLKVRVSGSYIVEEDNDNE